MAGQTLHKCVWNFGLDVCLVAWIWGEPALHPEDSGRHFFADRTTSNTPSVVLTQPGVKVNGDVLLLEQLLSSRCWRLWLSSAPRTRALSCCDTRLSGLHTRHMASQQTKPRSCGLQDMDNIMIRYDTVYLTCSKKLMNSQLSLPHRINKNVHQKQQKTLSK